MAVLIAPATDAQTSADVIVGATPVTISLVYNPAVVATPTRLQAFIDLKGSDGNYNRRYTLTGGEGSVTIAGAGTYRVRKPATAQAVGIDTN